MIKYDALDAYLKSQVKEYIFHFFSETDPKRDWAEKKLEELVAHVAQYSKGNTIWFE